MLMSVAAHVLVLALLMIPRPDSGGGFVLTEIDYLPGLPGAPAASEPVPITLPPAPRAADTEERFRRREAAADVAPEPQSDYALADRLAARLESLRRDGSNAVVAAAPAPVSARWSAASAGDAGTPSPGTAPVALTRGRAERAPLSLQRGAPVGPARLAPATIATAVAPARPEAASSASTASRDLAGARLSGPVADRPIVAHTTPAYPEWAKREAVEGSVTLRFFVRPDGSIKENVLVQKTAGFEDFDQNAVAALREWRFQALPAGRTGEQWGTITFHFRLRDAG
jgi:TonB family protein